MSDYLTLAQARAELGVSAFVFNARFRPELNEIRRGPRTILFDRVEVEALRGESDPMWKRRTVSDALAHTWETVWEPGSRNPVKKASLKDKVDEEIGPVRLDQLDYNRLEEWIADLRERDLSADTIKARLSCLHKALTTVAPKGWIKRLPDIPSVESAERTPRYLLDDPDEEKMLLDACGCLMPKDCDVMRLFIVVAVDTGCRVSELTKVRWKDVRNGRLVVERRKGKKRTYNHSIRLSKRAADALDALLENDHWMRHVRGCDKSATRRRTAQSWLTHKFAEVRDHAGLPDVHLHVLRHTLASRLVQAGVSLYDVKDILGHSSITVTEQYAHLAPSTADRAIDVLDRRALPNKVTKMRGPSQ